METVSRPNRAITDPFTAAGGCIVEESLLSLSSCEAVGES